MVKVVRGTVQFCFCICVDSWQAIVHSYLSTASTAHVLKLNRLFPSTRAVLFFGTPHLGSEWSAFHGTVLGILNAFTHTNTNLVKQLIPSSEVLRGIQDRYVLISGGFSNVFCYEQHPTTLPMLGKRLVNPTLTLQVVDDALTCRGIDSSCLKNLQHHPVRQSRVL